MGKRRVLFASAAVVAAGIGVGGIATAHGRDAKFHVKIAGTNEVPANDADARGDVHLVIDLDKSEVCYDLRFDRVGTPNRGHIHKAIAGANGGIVVPLFELATPDQASNPLNDQLERNRLRNQCVPGDPTVLADIVAHPAQYYVNFHNARFPGGAIRGQLG
jgi:CHRD domain